MAGHRGGIGFLPGLTAIDSLTGLPFVCSGRQAAERPTEGERGSVPGCRSETARRRWLHSNAPPSAAHVSLARQSLRLPRLATAWLCSRRSLAPADRQGLFDPPPPLWLLSLDAPTHTTRTRAARPNGAAAAVDATAPQSAIDDTVQVPLMYTPAAAAQPAQWRGCAPNTGLSRTAKRCTHCSFAGTRSINHWCEPSPAKQMHPASPGGAPALVIS